MRKLFPGYYRPTKAEFDALWQDCIFSFDASVLLNIYRYSPKTRERFFETLEALSDRVWITHQAAYEYHKNRLSEISKQQEPYSELKKLLNKHFKELQDGLQKILEKYTKRHSFSAYVDANQITEPIEKLHERLVETLLNASTQYPNQDDCDGFHEKLADLFNDKVGEPYSQEALDDVYEKAESRFQSELPPGYLDARGGNKKGTPECYGDVIIWFQLIDWAKSEGKPVILVTDDNKEDWWQKHQGKTYSPRPELVQEMLSKAGVSFYLYTGDRFLEYAEEFLSLPNEPEVIEEAREIRLEDTASQQSPEEEQSSTEYTPIRLPAAMEHVQKAFEASARANDEAIRRFSKIPGLAEHLKQPEAPNPRLTEVLAAMESVRKMSELSAGGTIRKALEAAAGSNTEHWRKQLEVPNLAAQALAEMDISEYIRKSFEPYNLGLAKMLAGMGISEYARRQLEVPNLAAQALAGIDAELLRKKLGISDNPAFRQAVAELATERLPSTELSESFQEADEEGQSEDEQNLDN